MAVTADKRRERASARSLKTIIDFAVGPTRPDLTMLLHVPLSISEARRQSREASAAPVRDRIEAAGRKFFERVERGFEAIAKGDPERVKSIDAVRPRSASSGAGRDSRDRPADSVSSVNGVGAKNPCPADSRVVNPAHRSSAERRGLRNTPY